jgi:CRP/FNR family transcriptional regulator, cyclic AMP receptor protein
MPRLSEPLDPEASPVAQFAWKLRSLRDQMGTSAPSVDEISSREDIPRSTLYAALSGHRLPRREVVAAIARQWGGDESDWLARRSEVERHASTTPVPEQHDSGLSPESVDILRAAGVRETFDAGTALMKAGEPADGVMLLEHGVAKVVASTRSGLAAVLGLRGAGDLVGEMAALNGSPRTASVLAMTPVSVSRIDTDGFTDLLHRHPEMMLELLRIMSGRLHAATHQQLDLATGASGRVLSYLRMLGERHGSRLPDGSLKVAKFLTQQELASTLGISNASVARALRDLRTTGAVTINRDEILVHPQG